MARYAKIMRPSGIYIGSLGFLDHGEIFELQPSDYDDSVNFMLETGQLALCTASGILVGGVPTVLGGIAVFNGVKVPVNDLTPPVSK